MGSGPVTTTNSNGSGASNGTSNGNTSQNFASQTNPWAAAQPQLQSLLGNLGQFGTSPSGAQTGAVNSLSTAASGIPNFSPQATNSVNSLLGGGGSNQYAPLQMGAYNNLGSSLSPLTNPANLNPFNTPGFSDAYNTMGNDITNSINGRFAAAGRDLSPANSTALARGLAQGQGGLTANQYNQNASNLMGASNSLYGAGAGTAGALTNFNQLGNTNQLAGMGAAGQIPGLAMAPGQAQFNVANLMQNLPLTNMGNYESLLTPLAQLGQSSSGNNSGQTNNQFQGQNTQQQTQTQQTQTPLWQQLAGLGINAASMFI